MISISNKLKMFNTTLDTGDSSPCHRINPHFKFILILLSANLTIVLLCGWT